MIALHLVLPLTVFNGTTIRTYADFDWTIQGNNSFRGVSNLQLPANVSVGIIDIAEILEGLAEEFGPFVDIESAHAGAVSTLTDILLERAVLFMAPGDGAPATIGTHTPPAWFGPSGVRLRETQAFFPTESADTLQAGGSGQVSNTLLADGQAGVAVFPAGMRTFIVGGAVPGVELLLIVQPFTSPRTFAELALQAAQPPAQFV